MNAHARRSTVEEWMDTRRPPADRLVRFEAWLRQQLLERLEWPQDPRQRLKQVGQCQRFVVGFLCDLNRRGWLFDGPVLARIIVDKLDAVAARQKAGEIEELWIYLRSVWSTYADAAAEKLHAEAMCAGFHISKIVAGLKTIPEATAERTAEISAEKLTRARRLQARQKAVADQPQLF
jgi:hypothetical protein